MTGEAAEDEEEHWGERDCGDWHGKGKGWQIAERNTNEVAAQSCSPFTASALVSPQAAWDWGEMR